MKTYIDSLLSEIRSELEELFKDNLVKIFLYGSYARNDSTNDSDIDIIALVNDHKLDKYDEEITRISVKLSLKFDLVVSIIINDYEHFQKYSQILPFYMNVINEGIEFYGK